MRKIMGLIVALAVGGAIGFGVLAYNKQDFRQYLPTVSKPSMQTSAKTDVPEDDMKKAQSYLTLSKPREAMQIISKHQTEINSGSREGKEWLALLVQASLESHDTAQLTHIFLFDPSALSSNEKAALLVAAQLIAEGKTEDYQVLRDIWKNKATQIDQWFVLDADVLIQGKKTSEAVELLQSKTFEGAQDQGRLIRLALLHIDDQPKTAWNFLTEAQRKNPNSSDVRTYRARFLESMGKPQLALIEYQAAVTSDPTNPFLKDQVADFYVRTKQFGQALQLWSENLLPPTLDSIWVKAFFWNKVIAPINFNWTTATPPDGQLAPFVKYLLNLQPGQFWDQNAFDAQPDLQPLLKTEQVTFWLRLLDALKHGQEDQATEIIQNNPFADAPWDPELLKALRRILQYQKKGTLDIPEDTNVPVKHPSDVPQNPMTGAFLQLLNELANPNKPNEPESKNIPENIQELLKSPEVFSAVFLAAGWREAGLQLHKLRIIPVSFPQWVAYNITEALRMNRGFADAVKFASLQKDNPSLSLLVGELLLANGNQEAGMMELQKLATINDDIGFKASKLLSVLYLEKKDYSEAKAVVERNPKLAQDLVGKEILARIALQQGDTSTAETIYTGIEQQSNEAKSYLARKAYADKNWQKAQELTEELLKVYPTNQILKENLKKIQNERSRLNP